MSPDSARTWERIGLSRVIDKWNRLGSLVVSANMLGIHLKRFDEFMIEVSPQELPCIRLQAPCRLITC